MLTLLFCCIGIVVKIVSIGLSNKDKLLCLRFKNLWSKRISEPSDSDNWIYSVRNLFACFTILPRWCREFPGSSSLCRAPAVSFDRKHSVFSTTLPHCIMIEVLQYLHDAAKRISCSYRSVIDSWLRRICVCFVPFLVFFHPQNKLN